MIGAQTVDSRRSRVRQLSVCLTSYLHPGAVQVGVPQVQEHAGGEGRGQAEDAVRRLNEIEQRRCLRVYERRRDSASVAVDLRGIVSNLQSRVNSSWDS